MVARRFRRAAAACMAAGVLLLPGCARRAGDRAAGNGAPAPPRRIISLAPSVTETLFALGLGDRVVGVTRFCSSPPQARTRPTVGGYLDVNYEQILALRPDLVVGIADNAAACARLERLGVATLTVDQTTLARILASVLEIADACGVPERGRTLADEIRRRIAEVGRRTTGLERPRALVVVDRRVGTGKIDQLWAAGPTTFYEEVLELAGGRNALAPSAAAYPELSAEGLLAADPDVILDLVPDLATRAVDRATALADWRSLDALRAVRAGRVHLLEQELVVVPGPRIADMVALFARALHPDLPWSRDD